MTNDPVQRLSKLNTLMVSDALDELQINGIATGLVQLSSRRRIAGRAVTVLLELAGKKGPRRYLGTAAVESSGANDVIVVQHRSRDDCAGWGGILSLAANVRGIQGAIVDGSVRALDQLMAPDCRSQVSATPGVKGVSCWPNDVQMVLESLRSKYEFQD